VEDNRLESALAELLAEQRNVTTYRNDYLKITRSRFHALRMLWFSFKQVLGLATDRDVYAVWSQALGPATLANNGVAPRPTALPESARLQHPLLDAWTARAAAYPLSQEPLVSVVIPVYNNLEVTLRCLQSIADAWCVSLNVQIIVVDDASSEPVAAALAHLPGLDCIRNGSNEGFVRSCNRGAALARGKYVYFLNNDTTVTAGWLDRLVSRAESDERIGVVGAKLVYPDGTLQEAGGIIWSDGTGWNYGRTGDPSDARYNYTRDVDYCSGAALLVRSDLFTKIGGFSESFVPAYYEDVDLCFAARSLGYRVVYEPRAEIVHYEGLSSGTDTSSGVKKFQTINLPKFEKKWRSDLQAHFEPHANNVPQAARRLRGGPVILIVDSYVPLYDKDAGSVRLLRIIKMMRELGYAVLFLPDNYAALQPYTAELQALGVEVLHHHDRGRRMEQALEEVLPIVDIAWVCRPELFKKYGPMIRKNSAIKIVYDTIDLHFMREKREAALIGGDSAKWKTTETLEIACAMAADATVVVSPDERAVLETYGIRNMAVIPTIHEVECEYVPGFEKRAAILFIGGYNHPPNVDAVKWLCLEIMPLVWKKLPDAQVTLLGSNPPPEVLTLESDRVRVPGYVRNVEPYFLRSRVFVAPMRFGAGIKGKVGHSLGYGLPVVTTGVGGEGFGLTAGLNIMLADTAQEFADAIVLLYSNCELWERLSLGSILAVEPFTSAAVAPKLGSFLQGLLSNAPVVA
jgi:GT2 family glycosyltransferase